MTIYGWLQVWDDDVWYLRGKGYFAMKEEEKFPPEEGFSRVPYILKTVTRLRRDLESMLTLTETYLPNKRPLRELLNSVAWYLIVDVSGG